jgi:DNA-binding transcriptional regulator YdaS (Cro superfamily)
MRTPIPELKDYLSKLPDTAARQDFARRCGTSLPYLRLVAGGFKIASAELAIDVDRESEGSVRCEAVARHIDFSHLRRTLAPTPSSEGDDQGRAAA